MTCPVCKRELASTLSICYACGTMVHDSVREELESKIEKRVSKPLEIRLADEADRAMSVRAAAAGGQAGVFAERESALPDVEAYAEEIVPAIPNPPPMRVQRPARAHAATERISRHTSQTLVEFQTKNTNVPDWRLQLQNAVRQRKTEPQEAQLPLIPGLHTHLVAGATALKPKPAPEPEAVPDEDPRIASALRRIEDSRRKFSGEPQEKAAPTPAAKNYPFNVVARGANAEAAEGCVDPRPATVNSMPRPRLVNSHTPTIERRRYETNKLPPVEIVTPAPAPLAVPVRPEASADRALGEELIAPTRIEAPIPFIDDIAEEEVTVEPYEEVDDLASLSTRFTAAVFDVIIGVFATAILLSPLLMNGGNWFSISGVLALAAAFGIVMFTYLTVAVGLRGRTVGMKLFALEVIDIEANEYPTFHQAAVSAAVYILALPLLGIGFLPALYNDERRAAHDLVSGTILVREL